MKEIKIINNYKDPDEGEVEIVERKGLGHPDTLSDGLAHSISSEFSKYTLKKFGLVLHHNVDKVYIGGGMFETSYEKIKFVAPINISVNGRMSTEYDGERIDVEKIQRQAIKKYLSEILPHLDVNKHLNITFNSNTFTDVSPYWYKPRSREDLPEYNKLMANDTAVCTASFPRSICERLAYELEQFFWIKKDELIKPRYQRFRAFTAVQENQ